MDSGNSTGSLQSSSTNGEDNESYDSRADSSSISAFLNPPPPPPPTTTNHIFNQQFSLSNYPSLDPTHTQKPNPLLNLDMVWSNSNSKSLRSDPFPPPPDLLLQTNFNQQNNLSTLNHQLFPPNISQTTTNNNSNSIPVRNPKKRSRASRRAPTTVLTTDTTNFRAMVQEFTGIPAPPFTSVSPFTRTRLDLSSSSSLDPPYLLRPFPHKPTLPDIPTTENNYQNLLNMGMQLHNPIFNLQTLLQQPPKIGSNGVVQDQLVSTTTNPMVANNTDLLPSDFKQNNVAASTPRTEGMLESWICSSD